MDRYNFKIVEKKWQAYWDKNKSYESKLNKSVQIYNIGIGINVNLNEDNLKSLDIQNITSILFFL